MVTIDGRDRNLQDYLWLIHDTTHGSKPYSDINTTTTVWRQETRCVSIDNQGDSGVLFTHTADSRISHNISDFLVL